MIDRTAEAVVLIWEDVADGSRTAATARRRLRALAGAGVEVAVVSATPADRVSRCLGDLAGAIQVLPDDGAEPPAALASFLSGLADRGIGPGLVLLLGRRLAPERSVGSSAPRYGSGEQAIALLAEQVRRRRARRVPAVDEDPAWIVRVDATDPLQQRVAETICTLGAGGYGTRGAVEEPAPGSTALLLADGVYAGPGTDALLPGPIWTGLRLDPPGRTGVRVLDLRTGVLTRREPGTESSLRTARFLCATRPGVVALRAEATGGRLRPGPALLAPDGAAAAGRSGQGGLYWARAAATGGGGIGAVARQRVGQDGPVRTVERLAAYAADAHRQPALGPARAAIDAATGAGFDRLLREQRAAWARRWGEANVTIPADPAAQLAVRYALFQLRSNVDRRGEAAVGARGLSGAGYGGHVFWDADAFVLPALVSIDPDIAWSMLTYRLRRLAPARAAAAAGGLAGARFPWESALTGDDVTPRSGRLGAQRVPILTGQQEEHITADVAWAAARYAAWTPPGERHRRLRPLLVETARYWSARCRRDADGRAHIDTVIGPDEYHETVDDNAFTNVMARWNLRAGAEVAERTGAADEAAAWRELADRLVDGHDPVTGLYEQFTGYFGLEPLLIADFARPPVAADLLLGRERVARSQLIKQPDVLMLHHLVPECVAAGSLIPNLDFYLPRTAHGSSLSPSVCAALLARAGRADAALEQLTIALDLDLHDSTGMTAGGLHLANLAGSWLAVLTGFAGVSVSTGVLTLDPHLPAAWRSLEIRFRCLGARVRLGVSRAEVRLRTDRPLRIRLRGHPARTITREGRWTGGEP